MERAASVDNIPNALIVCAVHEARQGDRLTGLLNASGLEVQPQFGSVAEADTADVCTTTWIVDAADEDELPRLAQAYPDARFLLFFETPADYLGPLLLRGERPEDHFGDWSHSARHLLAFLRQHRGRSILVDYRAALENPAALASVCREFGLELGTLGATSVSGEEGFEVERWLVGQWLKGQDDVEELESELEASAHPLADRNETETTSIDSVTTAYADRVREVRVQNERLEGEVAQILTEKKALQNDLDSARRKQGELHAAKEELNEENELLLVQLHQVQEELEAYYFENQKLRGQGPDPSATNRQQASASTASPTSSEQSSQDQQRAGWKSSLWSGRAERKKLKQEIKLISNSSLFDGAWYLEINTDVAEAGMNPAEHYLRFGASEGRNPSKRFDSDGYLALHQDVKEAGMNPLVHYLKYGKDEGRALQPGRITR